MGDTGGVCRPPFLAQDALSASVFEYALHEWRLTPEYIMANWTEAKYCMMMEALLKRIDPEHNR